MTIYLDVVLLENLCMNYIILFATSYFLKIPIKHIRLILSGLLGSIYALIAYMKILPIYSSFIMKIILSITMIYIAFKPKKLKILIKQLVIFYLTSFAFGGCAFALLYFIKPEEILIRNGVYVGTYPIKITILGGLVGFIIVYIAFKTIKVRIKKKDMIYKITIKIKDEEINVKALLDTGNLLKDPISNMPVVIVDKEEFSSILPTTILDNLETILGGDEKSLLEQLEEKEYLTKFRLIPFSSIGKQNGLMLGFKADQVIIEKEEEFQNKEDVIIGISNQKLNKNNQYSALISLELLNGRSDEHEFITNFKR